jgi:hypothetical protein
MSGCPAIHPAYSENILESGADVQIRARSMPEAKRMLKGVVKKYPQVNLNEVLNNASPESSYCSDMLHFNITFGGHSAGRSIVKTAFTMSAYSGVSPTTCLDAIDYLKNENSEACFGYY